MKTKNYLIIIGILILFVGIIYPFNNVGAISKEDAEFIGDNSVLYIQKGCPHCEKQLKLFGNNKEFLKVIDCWNNYKECQDIRGVPTWKVDNKNFYGIKSSEELKNIIFDNSIGKSEPYVQGVVMNEEQAKVTKKNIGDKI